MAIQEAEESENDGEDESDGDGGVVVKMAEMSKRIVHKVEWIGEAAFVGKDRMYYNKAKVGKCYRKCKSFCWCNFSHNGVLSNFFVTFTNFVFIENNSTAVNVFFLSK